jgi:hypothetical protein
VNRVTSSDGTTIAFDRLGDGPPVILVCVGSSDRTANAPLAALSDAQRRTLEGQTHDVAPEAIAPVLEDFFGNKHGCSEDG